MAELAGDEGEEEYDDDEGIVDDAGDVDDDDGGWITPANIKKVQAQFGEMHITPTPANVPVGCLTTDFAMQVWSDIPCFLVEILSNILMLIMF